MSVLIGKFAFRILKNFIPFLGEAISEDTLAMKEIPLEGLLAVRFKPATAVWELLTLTLCYALRLLL